MEEGVDEEEVSRISLGISDFFKNYTVNLLPQGYQCLLCSSVARDFFNHRTHMIVHLKKKSNTLYSQLMNHCEKFIIRQAGQKYTCMVCRKIMSKKNLCNIPIHFMSKHLDTPNYF